MPDGYQALPEAELSQTTLERRREAAASKAKFEAFIRGSHQRAAMLPRELIPELAFGVADLMLMQIVTGRLKPTTAKEAMEVAKGALDIARRESGEADQTIVIRTPEQRQAAEAKIKELQAQAENRRALEAGAPPIEDAVVIEDLDPDLETGARAGVPVRSAIPGATLGRVRPVQDVVPQEG